MKESHKNIIYGLIWCLICLALYYNGVSKPFEELKLIQNGQTTTGQINKCYESVEDDDGKTTAEDTCFYSFKLNDQVFEGMTHEANNELDQIEIEYLADNPEINRLKGEGGSTVSEWIWQRLAGRTFFLLLFLTPGILLIKNGVSELRLFKNKT